VFVKVGWGTIGAIAALVVAQFLTFLYAAVLAKKRGFTESLHGNLFNFPDIRSLLPELKYAALVLAGSLAITGMYSLDIIAVKHYFDAHTAGLYAGISTVARIIFFLTASISQVLLPSILLTAPAHKNRQILKKSLILLICTGGSALLFFAIFPEFVIRILMGSSFVPFAYLLPRLSLLLFAVSILNLFIMYNLALRRYGTALVVSVGIIITIASIMLNHSSPSGIINDIFLGTVTILALLGLQAILQKQMKAKNTPTAE
jgi:O-antigen/teichoic acid export membrane protein